MRNCSEKGATTLEAALTLIPFFLFLLGLIQFCILAYTMFSLQYCAYKTVRWGSTAQVLVAGETRFDSIRDKLSQDMSNMGFDTTSLQVNMCSESPRVCVDTNAGGSAGLVTLYASLPVPSVIAGLNVRATCKAVIKNEPF